MKDSSLARPTAATRRSLVGALAVVWLCTSGFDVWRQADGTTVRWPDRAVAVFLEDAPHGALAPAALAKPLKKAIATWNDVEAAHVRLVWGGIVAEDPRFDIFVRFSTKGFDERTAHPTGRVRLDADGGALERARIELDASHFSFTTSPSFASGTLNADLQGALTHLLGQALGLNLARDRAATMYFFPVTSEARSLDDDDIQGARFLYPGDGSVQPGGLCDACDGHDDCDGRCLTWPDNRSYCARSCATHDDCPVGFSCGTYAGGKACLPNDQHCAPTEATTPASGPCANDLACPSPLFCLDAGGGGFCTAGCSGFCAGFGQCRQVQLGSQVVGLCLVSGNRGFGEPCVVATDCAGLLCAPTIDGGGRCARPCASGCPSGAKCDADGEICVAAGDLQVGWPCESGFDCVTGLCVDHGKPFARVCASTCMGTKDCPAGTGCTPTSQGMFCLPFGTPPTGAPCGSPGACGPGALCDGAVLPGIGRCADLCSPWEAVPDCPVGTRCAWSAESAKGGVCRGSGPGALPGKACDPSLPCRVDLECAGAGLEGTCRAPCAEDAHCEGGDRCTALTNAKEGPKVCAPEGASLQWLPPLAAPASGSNFAARSLSLPDVRDYGPLLEEPESGGCSAAPTGPNRAWWIPLTFAVLMLRRRRRGARST